MNKVWEDFIRWMKLGKTLGDEWSWERHYKINEGEENSIR